MTSLSDSDKSVDPGQKDVENPVPSSAVLDTSNPTPLYHQLYLLFRHRILSGAFKHGDRLPSESAQETTYGVSRITAKRAMDELAREGLVTRERGRGTTVSYSMPPSSVSADFYGLMENLIAIGATTSVEVLSFEYLPVPANVGDALGLEPGALVQRAERRRSKDDRPFSHIVTYIPEDIGRTFDRQDLTDQPILKLIERSGRAVADADQSVTAVVADDLTSVILDVPQGAPLLQVKRVVRDKNGSAVQYIEVLYRPDVYQLNMRLARVDDDGADRLWETREMGSVE